MGCILAIMLVSCVYEHYGRMSIIDVDCLPVQGYMLTMRNIRQAVCRSVCYIKGSIVAITYTVDKVTLNIQFWYTTHNTHTHECFIES